MITGDKGPYTFRYVDALIPTSCNTHNMNANQLERSRYFTIEKLHVLLGCLTNSAPA